MNIIQNIRQGEAAWHAERAHRFTASQAPAMMGASKYTTRDALLREKKTGVAPEVTPEQQRLFDRGHQAEEQARAIAEEALGEDLFPVTAVSDADDRLLASFDGITMDERTVFEHKLFNAKLAGDIARDELEPHYYWQLEHQLLVSGADQVLFACSDGTRDTFTATQYTSVPERRAALIAGWAQFEKDLAAYVPTEQAATVTATPIESLPAVVVQVQGALTVGGNLPAFAQALREFIGRIPAKPGTDQEFADAEAACKALKKAEDALAQAEDGALAQISDVEQMRRTVADLKALARSTRLATEKLVAAEKDARREALVRDAQAQLIEHIMAANRALQAEGAGHLPAPPAGLFAPCIKGLKSLDSMRDKLTAELLARKTDAGLQAARLHANRASLRTPEGDWIFLFADFAQVGTKEAEDFAALAALRINQHQQREAAKLEAERQRIRAEEQHRAQMEAAEHAKAEQAARDEESTKLAQQQHGEDIARNIEAEQAAQAIASAATSEIASAMARKNDTAKGETLTLGALNAMLAPIRIDAVGLAELGFAPIATVKAAKHYPSADFAPICHAIANRAMAAAHAAHRAQVESA